MLNELEACYSAQLKGANVATTMKYSGQIYFFVFLLSCFAETLRLSAVSEPAVPEQYIIRLGDYSEEDIPNKLVPGAQLVSVYTIGAEKFALVRILPFLSLPHFDDDSYSRLNVTLHPNRIFHALSVDDKSGAERDGHYDRDDGDDRDGCDCNVQETGRTYWGLTRISSHDRPAYDSSDSYVYSDTGHNVTVFVIDSGVNFDHETFRGRAVHGYTVRDLLASEGATDMTGHGTWIASVIAGTYNKT